MDSNNTWKSLGTVLWILASSTHTLASTYICFIEDTFQTKNIKFSPRVGVGVGK